MVEYAKDVDVDTLMVVVDECRIRAGRPDGSVKVEELARRLMQRNHALHASQIEDLRKHVNMVSLVRYVSIGD